MANQRVTDLDAIVTLPDSGIIHVIDTTVTTQNAAGSSFKITKANLLKENTAAILLNTAKVGITTSQTSAITANTSKVGYSEALVNANTSVVANTAKVGITTGQASSITTNNAKVGYTDALVAAAPTVVANTAKVGISPAQASAITVNTAKVGYTEALVNANASVVANTAKTGISPAQATAITTNSAKVGITIAQSDAILLNTANTSKVSINTDAASFANVRSLRYREETYSSNLDLVMQTEVGVYNWVNIKTNAFNVVNSLVTRFKNRVATDGGVFSNQTALETFLGTITGSLTTVLAAITPNAVKAGKLFSVIPNTLALDATVVRNTTATTINSSGIIVLAAANLPRISHTLNTGGEGFILDEAQATNLVLYSDQIDNAAWLKLSTASVVANSNVSPDGTSNADYFNISTTLGSRIEQSVNLSIAGDYTYSVYLRALAPKTIAFRTGISNSAIVNINVTTTWTRFIITQNLASAPNTGTPQLRSIDTAGGSVFVWGQQFELGSVATSYVPTVASAITRNDDLITLAPPAGTVKITTTFSDNTTQVLTTIPATYTMPTGLIKSVNFNNTL